MKGRKPAFPAKPVIIIIIFLILCSGLWYLGQISKNLDYFKIKYIISNAGNPKELSYLKGINIFSVDLKKESRYISELYPNYRKIRLIKILPDRLFVDFIKRKPLAYVKLYRYFCVDEDLALFYIPDELQETDLPLILGLDTKIFGVKPGKKCNIDELALAINIIKEAKMNKALKDYKIKRINVPDVNNASLFISDGLEIKIGSDNIRGKINILSSLLNQEESGVSSIKYIDLRFKEPVIKLKDK